MVEWYGLLDTNDGFGEKPQAIPAAARSVKILPMLENLIVACWYILFALVRDLFSPLVRQPVTKIKMDERLKQWKAALVLYANTPNAISCGG